MFCTMLNPYIHNAKHFDKVVYGYRRRSNSLSTTLVKDKLTEQLKAGNQMMWVRKMNNICNRATEIVNAELIYT